MVSMLLLRNITAFAVTLLWLLQDHHQKPDGHTFASLLHACCQAGDQTLAHKVYHNALEAGCNQSLMIYDAAISSCQSPVDLDMAMQIYADMQRWVLLPELLRSAPMVIISV